MSYGEDREFLAKHTKVVELTNEDGARVAVTPDWQGRVMTSTCDGPNGEFIEITPLLAQYAVDLALLPVPSVAEMYSEAKEREAAEEERKLKLVDDMVGDCFPFLGRTSNVTPTSLMKKIIDQKKRGLPL